MSSTQGRRSVALDAVLELISVQLDGTTGIIKIPTRLFNCLDSEGQFFARRQASLILKHQVEFYLDSRSPNRVYLTNLASINVFRPCDVRYVSGSNLPVLFPAQLQQQGNSSHGTQHIGFTPALQVPQMPPPAPQNKRKRMTEEVKVVQVSNSNFDSNQKRKATPHGYQIFVSHHAPLVKAENPGIKFGQISAILAAKWKAMDGKEKEAWLQLARTKYNANCAEESAPVSGSAQLSKQQKIGISTSNVFVENKVITQDWRGQQSRAYPSSSPFAENQTQSPIPNTPFSNNSQSSQNHKTGIVSPVPPVPPAPPVNSPVYNNTIPHATPQPTYNQSPTVHETSQPTSDNSTQPLVDMTPGGLDQNQIKASSQDNLSMPVGDGNWNNFPLSFPPADEINFQEVFGDLNWSFGLHGASGTTSFSSQPGPSLPS